VSHSEYSKSLGRLVVTPPPSETETAIGYSLRLAQANGYQSAKVILPNGRNETQSRRGGDWNTIVQLTGISTEVAQRMEVTKVGSKYVLLGHSLALNDLRLVHHSVCPLCIEEDGFFDASWHLSISAYCAKHGVKLIDECPSCGSGLTLTRPGVGVCRCNALLASGEIVESCSRAVRKLMLAVRAKLYSNPKIARLPAEYTHLDDVSLPGFLALARSMHRYVSRQLGITRRGRLVSPEVLEIVACALCALRDGPLAAQEVLQMEASSLRSSRIPRSVPFGWYTDDSAGLQRFQELAPIGELIRTAVGDGGGHVLPPASKRERRTLTGDVPGSGRSTLQRRNERSRKAASSLSLPEGVPSWQRDWILIPEAAAQSKCSEESLTRAIEAGLLRGKYVQKHALAIHRSCIADLKPSSRRGWSDEEAAAFLGLSSSFLKWLVARQKLRLSHLPIEGGLFSHEDVSDLRARFRAARRHVLPYSSYMTVPRFLNAAPTVQAASATSVLEALLGTGSLESTTTRPPPRSSKCGGEDIYLILSDGLVTDPLPHDETEARYFTLLGNRASDEVSHWTDRLPC